MRTPSHANEWSDCDCLLLIVDESNASIWSGVRSVAPNLCAWIWTRVYTHRQIGVGFLARAMDYETGFRLAYFATMLLLIIMIRQVALAAAAATDVDDEHLVVGVMK